MDLSPDAAAAIYRCRWCEPALVRGQHRAAQLPRARVHRNVTPINGKYDQIEGVAAVPTLLDLEDSPDLVVALVANVSRPWCR